METIKLNLAGEIEEINQYLSENSSFEKQERALYFLSDQYRRLAIANFLGDLDTQQYFHFLKLSGETQKKLLVLSKKENKIPGRFQCASHIAPLFDAYVSGNIDLAKDIARHSTDFWIEDEEYEEDFYYATFLYNMFLFDLKQNASKFKDVLKKFEIACQDIITNRFIICDSFLNGDSGAFQKALYAFVEEWQNGYIEREKALPTTDVSFSTERYVCIEGMALLKLGIMSGFNVEIESSFMPRLAWI